MSIHFLTEQGEEIYSTKIPLSHSAAVTENVTIGLRWRGQTHFLYPLSSCWQHLEEVISFIYSERQKSWGLTTEWKPGVSASPKIKVLIPWCTSCITATLLQSERIMALLCACCGQILEASGTSMWFRSTDLSYKWDAPSQLTSHSLATVGGWGYRAISGWIISGI